MKEYLNFVNQAETQDNLFVFKEEKDAICLSKDLKRYFSDDKSCQIAWSKDFENENFFKTLNELAKQYKQIIFVCNRDNFDKKEVTKYSLKIDAVIYETLGEISGCFISENGLSKVIHTIKDPKESIIGKEYEAECSFIGENEERIFPYKNCFVKVWQKKTGNNYKTFYKYLTFYTLKIAGINIHVNEKGIEGKDLKLEVTDINGNKHIIVMPAKYKNKPASFREVLNLSLNLPDYFTKNEFYQVLNQLHLEEDIEETFIYQRPGYIKEENAWLYADEVIHFGQENNINKLILLSEEAKQRPYLNLSDIYSEKELCSLYLKTIKKGYNNSIEPFLVTGLAIMAPFRELLIKEAKGFCVAYLYGHTSSGKTNILNNIAYLYGHNENFIYSGDSTVLSMWYNLDSCNSSPIIYDEISGDVVNNSLFEGLIKSAYQGVNRDKISKIKTSINATLILGSNFQPPQKPEVLNRLLYCEFEQKNFNPAEVFEFNEIREKYLSNLFPAVLKYTRDEVIEIFKQARVHIRELNSNIDRRSIDNIAIAYTGYYLLLDIAEEDTPEEVEDNFVKFVQNYDARIKIESPWESFLNSLPLLAREKSIIRGQDYKVEEAENGKFILSLYFERAYKSFAQNYRAVMSKAVPTKGDIRKYAHSDTRIFKDKEQITKGVNIGGKKIRCLVIDVSDDYELKTL